MFPRLQHGFEIGETVIIHRGDDCLAAPGNDSQTCIDKISCHFFTVTIYIIESYSSIEGVGKTKKYNPEKSPLVPSVGKAWALNRCT
jgi:hypothetical protein